MVEKEIVKNSDSDSGESLAQIHKHIATFTCRTHYGESVKCIKLNSTAFQNKPPSLFCFHCLLSMSDSDKKSLVEIPEHLKKIIHYYNSLQMSNTTPEANEEKEVSSDESAILLEKSKEYIQKLKMQVEREKETILSFFEIIKKRLLDKLEERRNTVFKLLDDYFATVNTNINILNVNMKRLKSGISEYHTPTWDALLQKVQILQNAADFENLLSTYNKDIQENEILRELGSKKARDSILASLDAIKKYLEEDAEHTQSSKPLVNISKLSEFENSVSDWSVKLDKVVTELRLDVQVSGVPPFKNFLESNLDDSVILKDKSEYKLIEGWLGKGSNVNLKLIYRGSIDGFEATKFHSKCDNKGPTITLIESTGNRRFGGYSSIDWKSGVNDFGISAAENFLFSLDRKERYSIRMAPSNAIYHQDSFGPTFGGGYDLHIASNCNQNNSSSSNLGCTYRRKRDEDNSLAESTNFTVKEIEIFSVSV